MKRKVLVTGGAGYIGSVFVPELLKRDYQVTIIDNFMYRQNSLLDICYDSNLNIIVGDVRNKSVLKNQLKNHDIIIPLAAIVGAPACDKDLNLSKAINQEQIEDIAKWIGKDQFLLYPVTNSGYGIGEKDIYCTEESDLNPISHYGKTKVEGEKVLLEMGNVITFRLATVLELLQECGWIY